MSSNGSNDQSVPRGEAGDVTLERDGTMFQQKSPSYKSKEHFHKAFKAR